MKIVVLTGAGISAEGGIKTFRDSDGLWEGHDVMEVASPQGWRSNRELVQKFYNLRRHQLLEVQPNVAHKAFADLEKNFKVHIITQNVDDLHERAGSSHVLHLHGELLKVRSVVEESYILNWKKDLSTEDLCPHGEPLRPHIVWFGEQVPMLEPASKLVLQADVLFIVGTSMQVYPAAGLVHYTSPKTPIYFIDPKPNIEATKQIKVYPHTATEGVPIAIKDMLEGFKTDCFCKY